MTLTSLWSPAMPNLITVSELVDRAAPPTDDHRILWLRRARLWSVSGILPVAAPQATVRKHRAYSEDAIFLAAVLFRIADLGITTRILQMISATLQEADKRSSAFARLWRRSRRGEVAYISVYLSRDIYPEIWVQFSETGLSGLDLDDDGPAIVLNLEKVFEELSAAAAGGGGREVSGG
jgi:hypothetical protein